MPESPPVTNDCPHMELASARTAVKQRVALSFPIRFCMDIFLSLFVLSAVAFATVSLFRFAARARQVNFLGGMRELEVHVSCSSVECGVSWVALPAEWGRVADQRTRVRLGMSGFFESTGNDISAISDSYAQFIWKTGHM